MNEEEQPILQDADTKRHNKTVVIQTRKEIKKVHSHRHSDSSQKKSHEKHHHHNSKKNEQEYIQNEHQQEVQIKSEAKENKNTNNHVHFHGQKQSEINCSKERDELRKWKAFADHIIDMLLMSLPKSEIPSNPQVGKMAAIETLCSSACRLVRNPTQNPKYKELEAKYKKCKSQMKNMRKKCSQLHIEVQKNQQMLYQHMLSIQHKEENIVEKKLHNLETILAEQYKIQQMQFANLDEFEYNMSQRKQFQQTKNSPPRLQSNKIIKTKKIVKVANDNIQSNHFMSDTKEDDEFSSGSSTENEENSIDNEKNDQDNNPSKIIIIEEEDEEEDEEIASNSINTDHQTIQITKTTTIENS